MPIRVAHRDGSIDALRASMVLYIVGFWHLASYIGSGTAHVNAVSDLITLVVLGTFTLTSGVVLGASRVGPGIAGAVQFWRKRLVRIYPLYALALLGLVALWLTDASTAWRAAWLGSMFLPPAPMTLWFISMIMVFYLLAPMLLPLSAGRALMAAVALWAALLVCHTRVHELDDRVILYFPCFFVGLLLGRQTKAASKVRAAALLPALALSLCLMAWIRPQGGWQLTVAQVPIVLLGAWTLLLFGRRYLRNLGSMRAVVLLSYASFALYLFHRHVFAAWFSLLQPQTAGAQALVAIFVALPSSIAVAWALQSTYDHLLRAATRQIESTSHAPANPLPKERDS